MKKTLVIFLLLSLLTPVWGYGIQGKYLTLSGDEESYSTFQGMPLLVEAFASDCSHCHDQHSALVSVWENFNGSIQLLSLSVKDDETNETMSNYLIEYPSPWEVAFDIDNNFQSQYEIPGTPTILLFDSDGNLGTCLIGTQTFASLEKELTFFLDDPTQFKDTNEAKCPQPSNLARFINSILFPFSLVIMIYILYFIIRRWRDLAQSH